MPPRTALDPQTVHRAVAALASCQHGAFTAAQAHQLGATPDLLTDAVAAGRYARRSRSIYVVAGAPPSWAQDAQSALLAQGPDSSLSHRTAAWLDALEGFQPEPIEVTTLRGARRRTHTATGYRLHESTDLRAGDVVVVDGLARTTTARTFVDLGASASYFEVERAFDDAVRRGIVTVEEVRQRYLEVARRGRRGCGAIGRVLRRDDPTATASNTFEKLVLAAFAGSDVPRPAPQVRVDGPSWTYWIDLAWPRYRLGIECDSVAFHGTGRQLQHDDTRQNRLVLAGWTLLRYTWADAKHRPHVIRDEARSMLHSLAVAD